MKKKKKTNPISHKINEELGYEMPDGTIEAVKVIKIEPDEKKGFFKYTLSNYEIIIDK